MIKDITKKYIKKLAFVIVVLFSISVKADIVKFETNNFEEKRPVTWICKLIEIDRETSMAKFYYFNKEEKIYFELHVSRIYSLKIDNQDQVDSDLPPMRQDITTKLISNLMLPRKVELKKSVKLDVSIENIKHLEFDHIHIKGTLISVKNNSVNLLVNKTDNTITELVFNISDLVIWIR